MQYSFFDMLKEKEENDRLDEIIKNKDLKALIGYVSNCKNIQEENKKKIEDIINDSNDADIICNFAKKADWANLKRLKETVFYLRDDDALNTLMKLEEAKSELNLIPANKSNEEDEDEEEFDPFNPYKYD